MVTLIGANGAGKSTILKTVSGLLRTRTGSSHLPGIEYRRRTRPQDDLRGLAQVPEDGQSSSR